jgi:hypothetical protein
MSLGRIRGQEFLGLMFTHQQSVLLRALVGLIAVILLGMQAIHPGIHPTEVFGPSTHTHVSCPISHAAGDLLQGLPLLLFTPLIVVVRLAPQLWLGRLPFKHALVPRPPPTLHR